MKTNRRELLKYTAVAVSGMILAKAVDFVSVAEAGEVITLDQCVSMTPQAVAESSPLVKASWDYLNKEIGKIKDSGIRSILSAIYADPSPQLAVRLDAADRKEVWTQLQAKGWTEQSEADFLPPLPAKDACTTMVAPGSGYTSHHSYPGGLMTHVATNVIITSAIVDAYRSVYGYDVNRDIAMAAQLLHDLHKPYVFQWQADGSSRTEQPLAGTGEHHTLSLAELLVRKAPAELVVAQACAHTHPGNPDEEKKVVGWLSAAAVIAGVDPVAYGLLDETGQTLPLPRRQEGFLCHLGDHDFVLSVPAVQWTLPVMKEIAQKDYKLSAADCEGKPFNSLRNVVYSRVSAMRMHNVYAHKGVDGVRELMLSVVRA
ncbi:MAG: hypothetical protein ACOX5Z_08160 [Desulfobulbus sp.]|jgi:hypothetical protein